MTTFAELTTIGVGGPIARFIEPTTRVGVIEAIEEADAKGLPLCVIGGGPRRPPRHHRARRGGPGGGRRPHRARQRRGRLQLGRLRGVHGRAGSGGCRGALRHPRHRRRVRGAEHRRESVEVWDRRDKRTTDLTAQDLKFGYRSSALKSSMYAAPATPAGEFFPTPRYVVLSVTFALRHSATGTVGYGQLAKALGVEVGDRMETRAIRNAVLKVRASKGMLEDAARYLGPAMAGTKRDDQVRIMRPAAPLPPSTSPLISTATAAVASS